MNNRQGTQCFSLETWVKNLLYGKEILREIKLISYEMLANWPHFESKGV